MIEFDIQKQLKVAHGDMNLKIRANIPQGNVWAFYGESGAGKTSILRMIAGFMQPDSGSICSGEKVWFDDQKQINLKPQLRSVGIVFQDYALFPHMTVSDNISYGIRESSSLKFSEIVEAVDLAELLNRKPLELSGGQQQRVAIARAVMSNPDILLLDEPLSALDYEMRSKLQDMLIQIQKNQNMTVIMVSHDIAEIIKMCHYVVVLKNGSIEKEGSPVEVFTEQNISGKFKFKGTVIGKEKEDIIYIISVLVGNEVIKVVATESEAVCLEVGTPVLVASKAFNPLIQVINGS